MTKRKGVIQPFAKGTSLWININVAPCFIQGQIDQAEEESFNCDTMAQQPSHAENRFYPVRWACASYVSYL